MASFDDITYAVEDTTAIITIDRPERHNAFTAHTVEELIAAFRLAWADHGVRAVILTGAGEKAFCSGGDFRMLQSSSDAWSTHRRFRGLNRWLVPLITLEKPVVVGVNGHAVGGGMGLALTGDVVLAAKSAKFMSGCFRLGAIPDIGMMYHLPRLIGMARAKNFLFTGATMTADEAAELGLVYRVVPDSELADAGLKEAKRLAEGPAEVMGLAKILMARSFETSLTDMFAFEGLGQALAMSHPEFREGLSAAIEKRPANFAAASR